MVSPDRVHTSFMTRTSRRGMANVERPQITVREAEESDITKLAAVLAPELSAEQLNRRWQENKDGHREMLIAVLGRQVAGTVSTTGHRFQRPDSLRLFALDVGPAFRGQGIGTALTHAVEERARRAGLMSVNLEVSVENTSAMHLYERPGYRISGKPVMDRWERPTDHGGCEQVEDLSWVMTKALGASSKG